MEPILSVRDARTLLMRAQGLLDDPFRPATSRAVSALVKRLGFVQLDSINVVDRGHHLTLATRLAGYRPEQLTHLLERRRSLFEHWTHDASAIPTAWFAHWKPRFRDFAKSPARWIELRLGDDPHGVIRAVERRLRREGPLMASDFESNAKGQSAWWGWTPQKTALEYLWQTGRVTIAGRRSFNKVYDLTERVHPELCKLRTPGRRAQIEWACSTAMERLGVAAPGELAHFWDAVPPADATAWCRDAQKAGRIIAVRVENANDRPPRKAFAVADWQRRVARAPEPPAELRLLSPFDPVIRDRRRLQRVFGFEYRFEAFVPKAKRVWGYYVLPMLEGDRFVGRIDPKLHREAETLEVQEVHWEPGFGATPARRRALDDALAIMAERVGARHINVSSRARSRT